MNRGKEPVVSLCERRFVLDAIKDNKRLDGRGVYDYRILNIMPNSQQPGSVEVILGKTRVLSNVSCEVVRPRPQRPTEGELFFNVELSPMASPGFEVGRLSPMATQVARMLERCLKESRAVDTESLCIIAGEKVWCVRVDVYVLDYCGNITDCATIAAIAALKHFRRPDVTVIGEEATIHPVTERDPVPLSVHHMPFCVSFAFFSDGGYMLVDPSLTEEVVMEGRLVIGMNIHREICVLGMAGGVAILPDQLMRCSEIAAVKCQELTEAVKKALSMTSSLTTTKDNIGNSILESKRDEEVMEVMVVVRSEGESDDKEEEEEEVTYLGEGTAEVGLGGQSNWTVSDEEERKNSAERRGISPNDVIIIDDDDDVKEVTGQRESGGRGSSEEDEVVLLTDVGGFTKTTTPIAHKIQSKRGRGRKGGRAERQGTLGVTIETTPPAVTGGGRGRQGKKKRRKKQ